MKHVERGYPKKIQRFRRRRYHRLLDIVHDLRIIFSSLGSAFKLIWGKKIGSTFLERLMLSVTAVNKCPYCLYTHARRAFSEGMDKEEISALKDGIVAISPREQMPALLYAQHL